MVPRIHSYSLRSHIDDIENATKLFLMSHRPKGKRGILKSPLLSDENKVRRLRTKSPRLIDVLSQTLTITEYRIVVENLKEADLAISPNVEEIGFWQFNNAVQAIVAGEQAARKALDGNKLQNLLGQSGSDPRSS